MTQNKAIANGLDALRARPDKAAQTLVHLVECLYEKRPELSVDSLVVELAFATGFARGMAGGSALWTFYGRFSLLSFTQHYVDLEHSSCLIQQIQDALLALDATYDTAFVAHAVDYLQALAEEAWKLMHILQDDMNVMDDKGK